MRKRTTAIVSLFCVLAQLLAPAFPYGLRLTFLAPPLVASYHRLSFSSCLWLSFTGGLLVDLLGGAGRLGFVPLTYCLSTLFLYRYRHHFFQNSLTTIPLLSALFGCLVTLFQMFLLLPPQGLSAVTLQWVLTDLVIMSISDGIWAAVGFALPMRFLSLRSHTAGPYRMPRPQ